MGMTVMKDDEIVLIVSKLSGIKGALQYYNENPIDKHPDVEGEFESELNDLEEVVEHLVEKVQGEDKFDQQEGDAD
jgi:hypothetical protein